MLAGQTIKGQIFKGAWAWQEHVKAAEKEMLAFLAGFLYVPIDSPIQKP